MGKCGWSAWANSWIPSEAQTRTGSDGALRRPRALPARNRLKETCPLGRKEKLEGSPGAPAPIEFVMLVLARLLPFVVRQSGFGQLGVVQRPRIREVQELAAVFPADAPQFGDHRVGFPPAILVARIIDDAAVE